MKSEQSEPAVQAALPELPHTPAEPDRTIELSLAPSDLMPLARRPDLVRAASARSLRLIWLDDSDATLTTTGRIVERAGRGWRLEALEPGHGVEWPPCSPPPLLDEAPSADALVPPPPFDAAPVAAFDGKRHSYRMGDVELDVLHGSLRGLLDTSPACRLRLTGSAAAVAESVIALAGLQIAVPRATLAREALAVAKGGALPARHLGAPALVAEEPLSEGLSHIIGHLLDALLFWIDIYRRDARAEAVHQGRVATRRLRSALSIYRHAISCDELAEASAALQQCASTLGAARDWDVFVTETGVRLHQCAGSDPRIAALLRAAKRRRQVAHAELATFLAGPNFRRLELALGVAASLRPWERGLDRAVLATPTGRFATAALERRIKHVRRRGKQIETLPLAELHEFRKDCKRLRYAAEFFAPSFPAKTVKPFLRRLATLQEELGTLNDTAVASQLMAQLGRAGSGYAGGMVEGWASAAAQPARQRIARKWKRFRAASPFWPV